MMKLQSFAWRMALCCAVMLGVGVSPAVADGGGDEYQVVPDDRKELDDGEELDPFPYQKLREIRRKQLGDAIESAKEAIENRATPLTPEVNLLVERCEAVYKDDLASLVDLFDATEALRDITEHVVTRQSMVDCDNQSMALDEYLKDCNDEQTKASLESALDYFRDQLSRISHGGFSTSSLSELTKEMEDLNSFLSEWDGEDLVGSYLISANFVNDRNTLLSKNMFSYAPELSAKVNSLVSKMFTVNTDDVEFSEILSWQREARVLSAKFDALLLLYKHEVMLSNYGWLLTQVGPELKTMCWSLRSMIESDDVYAADIYSLMSFVEKIVADYSEYEMVYYNDDAFYFLSDSELESIRNAQVVLSQTVNYLPATANSLQEALEEIYKDLAMGVASSPTSSNMRMLKQQTAFAQAVLVGEKTNPEEEEVRTILESVYREFWQIDTTTISPEALVAYKKLRDLLAGGAYSMTELRILDDNLDSQMGGDHVESNLLLVELLRKDYPEFYEEYRAKFYDSEGQPIIVNVETYLAAQKTAKDSVADFDSRMRNRLEKKIDEVYSILQNEALKSLSERYGFVGILDVVSDLLDHGKDLVENYSFGTYREMKRTYDALDCYSELDIFAFMTQEQEFFVAYDLMPYIQIGQSLYDEIAEDYPSEAQVLKGALDEAASYIPTSVEDLLTQGEYLEHQANLKQAIRDAREAVAAAGPVTRVAEKTVAPKDNAWYDLSGRRLNGKPAKRGAYVVGGKLILR